MVYELIKKYFLLLIFMGCSILNASSSVISKDVTICLFNGKVVSSVDPVLAGFAMAIKEVVAPIIVSKSLLAKVISIYKKELDPTAIVDLFQQHADTWEAFDIAKAATIVTESQQSTLSIFIDFLIKRISSEHFNEWSLFFVRATDLAVLVPKKLFLPGDDIHATSKLIGMPLGSFIQYDFNGDYIELFCSGYGGPVSAEAIGSCFIEDSQGWNIFLFGHGSLFVHGSLFGHGSLYDLVAQLSIIDFQKLLNFFEKKIKTKAFFYKTCHSGGANNISFFLDSKTNEPLVFSYPIVCLCSNNMPTLFNFTDFDPKVSQFPASSSAAIILASLFQGFKNKADNIFNLGCFYSALHELSTSGQLADLVAAAEALTPLQGGGSSYKRMTNLPRFRPAGEPCFSRLHLPVAEGEQIICFDSDPTHQALELDDKGCIILSCHEVKNPLVIKGGCSPAIISVMPWEAIHVFDSITSDKTLEAFLQESFCSHQIKSTHFYNEIPFSQIFLIKSLSVSGPTAGGIATYSNVIVLASAPSGSCCRAYYFLVPKAIDEILLGALNQDEDVISWESKKGPDLSSFLQVMNEFVGSSFLPMFKERIEKTPFLALASYVDKKIKNTEEYLFYVESLIELLKSSLPKVALSHITYADIGELMGSLPKETDLDAPVVISDESQSPSNRRKRKNEDDELKEPELIVAVAKQAKVELPIELPLVALIEQQIAPQPTWLQKSFNFIAALYTSWS